MFIGYEPLTRQCVINKNTVILDFGVSSAFTNLLLLENLQSPVTLVPSSSSMSDGFIQTKSSRLRTERASDFQEVTFVSHKPKPKQASGIAPHTSKLNGSAEDIDMKKARSEIMRLAMSGMVGQEKHQSKRALAISLGAIPGKRKKVNYKVLKEKRKKEKELAKSEDPQTFSSSNQKSLLSSKIMNRKTLSKSSNKKKSDILGVYGKVNRKDLPS